MGHAYDLLIYLLLSVCWHNQVALGPDFLFSSVESNGVWSYSKLAILEMANPNPNPNQKYVSKTNVKESNIRSMM